MRFRVAREWLVSGSRVARMWLVCGLCVARVCLLCGFCVARAAGLSRKFCEIVRNLPEIDEIGRNRTKIDEIDKKINENLRNPTKIKGNRRKSQ